MTGAVAQALVENYVGFGPFPLPNWSSSPTDRRCSD